ncbi:HAD family hydrolase [miscellaneous Crenarchaeota group archaeon SMTZ-80]|nr:MAG: HAD family hydrolase [miscellaneous Crenarchaeota group archaeon SMTZ-80]
MTREKALALLHEYTKSEELWGSVGLIHDFDYEIYPDEHPQKGSEILAQKGISEELRKIILGHADFTGVPRESLMAKVLYAVDELCGFIIAVTLVRPNKSIGEVQVKSVKKKMKDKSFAAKVNRDEIRSGAEELGVDFDEHVNFVIQSLTTVAEKIGVNP